MTSASHRAEQTEGQSGTRTAKGAGPRLSRARSKAQVPFTHLVKHISDNYSTTRQAPKPNTPFFNLATAPAVSRSTMKGHPSDRNKEPEWDATF